MSVSPKGEARGAGGGAGGKDRRRRWADTLLVRESCAEIKLSFAVLLMVQAPGVCQALTVN